MVNKRTKSGGTYISDEDFVEMCKLEVILKNKNEVEVPKCLESRIINYKKLKNKKR